MSARSVAIGSVQPSWLGARLREILVLVRRNLIHILREPMQLSDVTLQPILFTLLFIFVFGSGIPIPGGSYTDFALAGLLVMNLITSSNGTAVGLSTDLNTGLIDRFRALPMWRPSLPAPHLGLTLKAPSSRPVAPRWQSSAMTTSSAGGPLRAVVLDMDGLLIDTEPVWRAAEREVFGELGIELSEADMLSTMGRRIAELVAHWRRVRPWPGAETGEPGDAVIADRVIDRMVDHVRARGEPMRGVGAAMALLRRLGLRVAIASSSSHRLIDAVCERLQLEWIEIRCSADDEVRGKPAGDVYLTAARRLGLSPAVCLAIEDSPNGVLSARAAGMRCIAVPDRLLSGDQRYGEAQLVLGSLDELDEARLRALGWRDRSAEG